MFCNITGVQLGGEGGDLPRPFEKIEKSVLILGKKDLDFVHLFLNFPFKM